MMAGPIVKFTEKEVDPCPVFVAFGKTKDGHDREGDVEYPHGDFVPYGMFFVLLLVIIRYS